MRYSMIKAIYPLAALLLLTSCSQDEIMDDNALPEGKYPLEIASVSLTADVDEQPWGAKAPQTRVSESEDGNSSVWQTGDKIKVQIGDGTPGTYTYQGGGTLTVADGDRPAYWTSKENGQTIKAWYTSSDGETVDLADQTNDLAYIVTAQTTADFNTSVSLNFSHALAKVCVYLKGTAYDGKNDNGVTLSYPASCTVKNGEVTQSDTNGTIQMHKVDNHYEALVLTGTIGTSGNPFKVTINNATSPDINLTAALTLTVGNKYDVTLKVHQKETEEVDLSDPNLTSTYTINGSGIYYFYNSGKTGNCGIKVTSGSPQIYLDDAKIEVSSGNAIDITNGSPTIHVRGNNTVSTNSGAGIYIAQNNTVTITSTSRDNVLKATGGNGGNGIGGYTTQSGYNYTSTNSGNIFISNVTVYAYGSNYNGEAHASGIGGAGSASCGTITIDNATIFAYGTSEGAAGNMSTPGIGGGQYSSNKGQYGKITIKNSDVSVKRGSNNSDYIGSGGSADKPATSTNGIDATVSNSNITKLN